MFKQLKNWGKNLLYSGILLAGSLGFNGCSTSQLQNIPEQKYEFRMDFDNFNQETCSTNVASLNRLVHIGTDKLITPDSVGARVGKTFSLVCPTMLMATYNHENGHANVIRNKGLTPHIELGLGGGACGYFPADEFLNFLYSLNTTDLDESMIHMDDEVEKKYGIYFVGEGLNAQNTLERMIQADGTMNTYADSLLHLISKIGSSVYLIRDSAKKPIKNFKYLPDEMKKEIRLYQIHSEMLDDDSGMSDPKGYVQDLNLFRNVNVDPKKLKQTGTYQYLDMEMVKDVLDVVNYWVNGEVTHKDLPYSISPWYNLELDGVYRGLDFHDREHGLTLSYAKNITDHKGQKAEIKFVKIPILKETLVSASFGASRALNTEGKAKWGREFSAGLEQMFGSFGFSAGVNYKRNDYNSEREWNGYLGLVFKF